MTTIKRINLNELVWFVLLSGFTLLLFHLISSEQIYSFIHPRLHKYIFFACIAIFILTVNQLKNITKKPKHPLRIKKGYFLFCLPLIFMTFGSNGSTLKIASENGVIISSEQDIQLRQSPPVSKVEFQEEINESLEIPNEIPVLNTIEETLESVAETENQNAVISTFEEDVLTLTSENFVNTCNDIYTYMDDYLGKEVKLKGMILKREDFENNHFIVGRLLMYCCAADAQIVGMMCQYEYADSFENDEYVELTGTIDRYLFYNQEQQSEIWIPIIRVEEIHKTEPLTNPYVYFEN